ncbi:GGDEF domain-containing protein [Paenibacillus nasutitermitis]|uniref:GGDEF domain-containing protein n=1 Tax=Paenibacillus nasutitermitis TaxID=1652958 RepID=A0A916Z4B3_9BACL|nr:GGDEF domain-containing protein [Paenibacillus nasutitermitis]GGD75774.1 hypothetical protein GCM10010911_37230 [Paenibacillus nasutitermitis]
MCIVGRVTACAIALITILLTVGLSVWQAGASSQALPVAAQAVAVAAFAFPVAWFLGLKYDRLLSSSTLDYLTGLCNRRYMEQIFPKIRKRAQRKRKKITVLMIDVNDFKEVNDKLGHIQGDRALKMISQLLGCGTKQVEIVGRWGGDEFIMICPYSDDRRIETLIRQLHEKLFKLSASTGLHLSISVGSAICPDQGSELNMLVQIADNRMYADKQLHKLRAADLAAMQA